MRIHFETAFNKHPDYIKSVNNLIICSQGIDPRMLVPLGAMRLEKNPAYTSDNATHKLCRKFLALPYLPKEHIPTMFENLATKATTPLLAKLVTYIRLNWIEGNHMQVQKLCI